MGRVNFILTISYWTAMLIVMSCALLKSDAQIMADYQRRTVATARISYVLGIGLAVWQIAIHAW